MNPGPPQSAKEDAVPTFDEFFETATRQLPYGYQVRLALDGLPAAIEAPTGTGKTGVILAWLWRRLHGPDRGGTPRRLIYALPQRSLVEQVAGQARGWLAGLGLTERVALHVVMGGEGTSQGQWRQDMHLPAIVVGTVDSLVSKALNRGYGIGRATYPIDFALVTNGAHWVIDEIQLCPESTTTLRQLAAFTARFGTAEPFGLTCMSATIPEDLLGTVDNPSPGPHDVVGILPGERSGQLAARLDGRRTVRRLDAGPGEYGAIAAATRARHRPGTLTLVVVNTVEAARQTFKAIRDLGAPAMLLHSRFRGTERQALVSEMIAPLPDEGRIVVATQVVEAGIDLNAAVLVTEAAPWPSVVQRAGRCNRTGLVPDAELWWLPPATPAPYEKPDVDGAAAELAALEGTALTGEELQRRPVAVTPRQVAVLRRPDLVSLFDTAPDLGGADIDISPYVRDAEDLDAQVAWAEWEPAGLDGRPPDDARSPLPQWRCRVPLQAVGDMVKRGIPVWRLDQAQGRWTRVGPAARARPGEVLVVATASGGYDPAVGLDPSARAPVAYAPALAAPADVQPAERGNSVLAEVAAGTEDRYRDDTASVAQRDWLSLDRHSEDTRDQAAGLLTAICPDMRDAAASSVVTAAYLHDVGKAHPIWQDALCNLAPAAREAEIHAGRPWAKSGINGRLDFGDGVSFRHELASLLLLDGPLRERLSGAGDADLARYLVLAHHGKLRIQVRGPDDDEPDVLLGLHDGKTTPIPPMLGQPGTELTIDLEQFELGGDRSWTRTALALRDRYGPFVLAYLETLVRVADWRASAGAEVPR